MSQRWKIFLVGVAGLLGVAGIWLATLHYQPESEVEAYKNLLRARGEKLEIAEVAPPPVPPEQNSVDMVEAAFKLLVFDDWYWTNLPPMMHMVLPGRAIIGWRQSDLRGGDFTNTWENAAHAAEANRAALDLIQSAMERPALDFQLDYRKGPEVLLPHLAPMKRSAQALSASAICALHAGDAGSATTNLCTLLALVQGQHDERLLISQLVRMAMTQIAFAANWELLQSTNVTDGQLAAVQKGWERLEFIEAAGNSMLMERAMAEVAIQKMRTSPATFNRWTGYGSGGSSGSGGSGDWFEDLGGWAKDVWGNAKFAGAKFMWQTSWTYSDELRALQGDQIILEALRTIGTNQFFEPAYTNMMGRLETMGITNSEEGWMRVLDIPDLRTVYSVSCMALGATVRKTMSVEFARRSAITAIALKRHQLRQGSYPAQLSDLTPEFLATLPLDPVDGRPLRYRLNPDGTFLLYSIGEDGVDDGGNPLPAGFVTPSTSLYWQHGRDWIWPQPATPGEVQDYYNRPTNF